MLFPALKDLKYTSPLKYKSYHTQNVYIFEGVYWRNARYWQSAIKGFDRYNRELKQETFLSTRTPTENKSRRYRWRMIVSAVLVLNQERQSISFHVRDFKRERLMPSFAIYSEAVYFRLTSVLTKASPA